MITPIKVPQVKIIKETTIGRVFRDIISDLDIRAINGLKQKHLKKVYPEFVNRGKVVTELEASLPL